jgi:hypothetical protein
MAFVLPAAADAALIVPKPPTVIVPKATASSHPAQSGSSAGSGPASEGSPPPAVSAIAGDPSPIEVSDPGAASADDSQGSGSGSAAGDAARRPVGGSAGESQQPSVLGWLGQQFAQARANEQIIMAVNFANWVISVSDDNLARFCPSFNSSQQDEHINNNIRTIGCF